MAQFGTIWHWLGMIWHSLTLIGTIWHTLSLVCHYRTVLKYKLRKMVTEHAPVKSYRMAVLCQFLLNALAEMPGHFCREWLQCRMIIIDEQRTVRCVWSFCYVF